MAPHPQCAALVAAQAKSGISWAQVGAAIGKSEQQVISIIEGSTRPTEAEFNAIAKTLGITNNVPHTGVHATV
ncbi:hypothetical protein BDN70DRAFT_886100 [Pholiota conissans]|uniref:HTH cro/C1-type domain-containing protein n=1 Tax=Pholiota conissans TaxID=109636 RepID=A0A9P5YNT4_9AGAR|nr:hypothetical protein BDN70DRAFT_886100 [Pholiota conissans]